MPAQQLQRGAAVNMPREVIGFLNGLVKAINDKNAGANQDAPTFDLTVTAADASDPTTTQDLANDLKDVVNLLIAYINLVVANDNALRANLRAAELLQE